MSLEVIVTGTGRCGTNYMANVLTSAGIPCGRESVFRMKRTPKKGLKADSSWYAAAHLRDIRPGTKIVHIVRNPFNVIRGVLFDFKSYFSAYGDGAARPADEFMISHAPRILQASTRTDRAILLYLEWNKLIEENVSKDNPYLFHRVEDPVEEVLEWLGVEAPENLYSNKKCNTRQKCMLTKAELEGLLSESVFYRELEDMIIKYNYL